MTVMPDSREKKRRGERTPFIAHCFPPYGNEISKGKSYKVKGKEPKNKGIAMHAIQNLCSFFKTC